MRGAFSLGIRPGRSSVDNMMCPHEFPLADPWSDGPAVGAAVPELSSQWRTPGPVLCRPGRGALVTGLGRHLPGP